ncbi:uncharacterized protein HMPREF1541_10459 [Cyphellophora europaea CBS 101466]|uniref:Uncharacterized protein n=1 Tax=Cyphellophora europaea (strain CBS 101466) TaxID=1220924 RepID=W2S8L9_CYPE1|nr:uncharacterized protein HMPREF1541_10459 [Cyphellophora europaea CBS 101466]ETN44279.1 hypothetical protein HMPREF1541_10459 [Cyphellophora europaea CBS 101466]
MLSRYSRKLQGQRVLVLGGTSGIGFCVAQGALEQGAVVIISGSKQDKIDSKMRELEASYPEAQGRILGKACDLANLQSQEGNLVALLDFATENKTKKLDHIAYTAGTGVFNPAFSDLTVEMVCDAQRMRVFAPLMLMKHAETYLNKSPASSLTFTSGEGTYRPQPGWTLMIMIGGMFDGLVRSGAVNLAPIRVNCVAPGAVMTELWGGGQMPSEEQAKLVADRVGPKTLTGQIGMPEDVAEAYLYFMKDRNATGRVHVSEGGSLLK